MLGDTKIPKQKIDYQRVIDFLSFVGWSVNETAVAVKGKILWLPVIPFEMILQYFSRLKPKP